MSMKLKGIPDTIVVHTPTEEQAKELLAILHENGYCWSVMWKSLINNNHWHHNKENTTYLVNGEKKLVDVIKEGALMFDILTLAEFKEKYVEEEKPQPKFREGDLVIFPEMDRPLQIHAIVDGIAMSWWDDGSIRAMAGLDYLKPYTKPVETIQESKEKPQPKFRLSERIRIVSSGVEDFINMITEDDYYELLEHRGKYSESDLEPYTESETKVTEESPIKATAADSLCTMAKSEMDIIDEAKEKQKGEIGNNSENSQLDLCELIGDRDGIKVYCSICGEVTLQAWYRGKNTKPFIFAQTDKSIVVRTFANGKAYAGGECVIFPSRALYEQYPLDPYTAWMEWKNEQKKPFICIHWGEVDANGDEEDDYTGNIYFRTISDRDKCIEEIRTTLKKYSE